MTTKDYREIQVSSSVLIFVFIGVLVLGVFVFLLGVSVGKKQAAIAAPSQVVTERIPEPLKEPPSSQPSETAQQSALSLTPSQTVPEDKTGAASSVQAAPAGGTEKAATAAVQPAEKPSKPPAEEQPAAKTDRSKATSKKSQPAMSKSTAVTASSGLYYVQVSAFTSKAQAQASADKFRKQGYQVTIAEPRASDTKTWYRVRIGSFSSRDKAVEVLNKLNAAAGKKTDFRIVKD